MSAGTAPEHPDEGRETLPADADEVERAADTVERVERHSEQSDDGAGIVPNSDAGAGSADVEGSSSVVP